MEQKIDRATTRTATHECGCVVEYATDRHGEYPLAVEGCDHNEALFDEFLGREFRDERNSDFVARVQAHRGKEVG